MSERPWTTDDVHEALLRWGPLAARIDDRGMGYPKRSLVMAEMTSRGYEALYPTDLTDEEFEAINAAVLALPAVQKAAVLAYFKPGFVPRRHSSGSSNSPIRDISRYLRCAVSHFQMILDQAQAAIADTMNRRLMRPSIRRVVRHPAQHEHARIR